MAEARLGIRTVIYDRGLSSDEFQRYLGWEKDRAKHQMGEKIIEHLIDLKTPCVVRINEQLQPNYNSMGEKHLIYSLIADFNPVEMMHVRMMELPPFEFVAPYLEKQTIEWQCDYCGQVNLVAEHLECRKCGAPRKAMK